MKSFPVIDLVATGKNIVRLRKESGLSVTEFQEYFGFHAPQTIYKWQKGQCLPSTDNLLALGYLLNVPMEDRSFPDREPNSVQRGRPRYSRNGCSSPPEL